MVTSKFSYDQQYFRTLEIFCSKWKLDAIIWRRERNWRLSDLLLSNWSHVMLLFSLEFHFRALRNVHTDPVSEPNFFCLSRDAFSGKENPLLTFSVQQKYRKPWLKYFSVNRTSVIVEPFQIHDELQASKWTEKGPLKRDWHGGRRKGHENDHRQRHGHDKMPTTWNILNWCAQIQTGSRRDMFCD